MNRFNAKRGLIIIRAELFGPSGSIVLRLTLDTGATGTMVNVGLLTAIGYDPSLTPDRVEVTTGSGVVYAPRLEVSRIKALGQERAYFPVLAHTFPDIKVLIGGAPITQDFCTRIGADFYSPNPHEAVEYLNKNV
jgi:predicted aspartyl protease